MNFDKYICNNCIEEPYFKKYIKSDGIYGKCNFCGDKGKVLDFDTLIEDIIEGIEYIYDDPANGLGFLDGEYVKGNGAIYDTYDLLSEVLDFGGSKAFQDIVRNLPEQLWCKKKFYGFDPAQEKIFTWEYFIDQVKYKTRYFFIQEKTNIRQDTPYNKPFEILSEFSKTVEKFRLINILKKGDKIYRARRNYKNNKYRSAKELGTPMAFECVKSNRMSPAGIPMFYASLKKETCIAELKRKNGKYTIGKWTPTKNLNILDLTKHFLFDLRSNRYFYPNFHSVFDKQERENYFDYQFILKFASDLSGQVEDNISNIEYVPTQIVAEFLRKVAIFNGKHLDGICFYSSVDGGINYALFIQQEECDNSGEFTLFKQKIKLLSVEEVRII
jgi:hypothetical protein